jgi:hypothetical protein
MGRVESVNASIGIKILLTDLVSQMNETNATLIQNMLDDGCIEDDNNYSNQTYQTIVDNLKTRDYLLSEFTTKLKDEYLLVPLKSIISTERWGYNREGKNSRSMPMQDLSVNTDEYNIIKNWELVFIIIQNAS